jgi:hypothetical protein
MQPPRRHSSNTATTAQRELGDPDLTRDSPTLPPPFDLEDFARENLGRADERIAPSDRPTEPAPEDPASSTRLRARASIAEGGSEVERTRAELAEKFFAADYPGALALAEHLASLDPTDGSARDFAEECRRMLERAYAARLGSLDRVPVLAVGMHELRGRSLDNQAGFLLSRIDGVSTLEALLDVCAMPRLDALRLVTQLVEDEVLRLEG